MALTQAQIAKFRERLLALEPPAEVVQQFDQMLEIRQDMEIEDNLEDILFDACRSKNWTKPWESNGISLTIRAKLLSQSHPEYHHDSGGDNSPATEQAYRRGVVHGIQQALNILNLKLDSNHPVADAARKIFRWRCPNCTRETVWRGGISQSHSINVSLGTRFADRVFLRKFVLMS